MERPHQLEHLANQLNDITAELTEDDVKVGIGKTFDKETKDRFFTLFIYCKTRKVCDLLQNEIGDAYEDVRVTYRSTRAQFCEKPTGETVSE